MCSYCTCVYNLDKISGKYNRDITEKDYQNCLNDCVVFKGGDCFNDMLDHVSSFKGEAKRVINKIVEISLYLVAHNGFGSDSLFVLNNPAHWRSVFIVTENGDGNISLKIFNGYLHENKKVSPICSF